MIFNGLVTDYYWKKCFTYFRGNLRKIGAKKE